MRDDVYLDRVFPISERRLNYILKSYREAPASMRRPLRTGCFTRTRSTSSGRSCWHRKFGIKFHGWRVQHGSATLRSFSGLCVCMLSLRVQGTVQTGERAIA